MPTRPRSPSRGFAPPAADGPPEQHKLPKINVSPLASLPPRPMEIDAYGKTWTIPAMSAAQWLEILWAEPIDLTDIWPGLGNAFSEMIDALFDGDTTADEAVEVACEVVAEASGLDYWVAFRLAACLRVSWLQVGGALLKGGLRPEEVSLGTYLVATLAFLAENMDPAKAVELFEELNRKPMQERTEEDDLDDARAFMAAMAETL